MTAVILSLSCAKMKLMKKLLRKIKIKKLARSRHKVIKTKKGKRPRSTKVTKRKKEVKMRKSFFLTLVVIILLWSSVAFVIYFLDPFVTGAIPFFLFLAFLTLFLTFSTLFANSRRGLLTALSLTAFLILRYLAVGNILNFLLITALAVAVEFYLSKK